MLERGVQLLEALLERVALVILHQLLQGAHTPADHRHCLQAVLLGALASLSHPHGFTWGIIPLTAENSPFFLCP